MYRWFAVFSWMSFGLCAAPMITEVYDVVVYGSSSAGVMAAIEAANMGRSTALIAQGNYVGGMSSSGLGYVDVGLRSKVAGLAKYFFTEVAHHYKNPAAWKWQPKTLIHGQSFLCNLDDEQMWLMEPNVAQKIFRKMLMQAGVQIIFSQRLNRESGVIRWRSRIQKIIMESGRSFSAKVFIDASYVGDLMASAGVSYVLGREGNACYNETLNGICPDLVGSSLIAAIDPYVLPGDPSSGLLARVQESLGGVQGDGDDGVQAYNYRLCLTDIPGNCIKIEKPAEYNEEDYELLFRAVEAGLPAFKFLKLSRLPNKKIDCNNEGRISSDYIGMSSNYAEASYSERYLIARAHENWIRGLIWSLQNHPRIPENIRQHYSPWGLAKDEFVDNRHWPYELYVRESRRMCGQYVITEHTATGADEVIDPIAYGSYPLDSHAIKYYVSADGHLAMDGVFYRGLQKPYSIPYRSILPSETECSNLLVPVCLSASHVAYGSLRMEPVFMMVGQAAGLAASLCIDYGANPSAVPYNVLKQHLLKIGLILE